MIEANPWPALDYDTLAPTLDYLNRIVQVAGKYTLDELFEVGWGNIVFEISPRGLRTPTLRRGSLTFSVHYRLLDDDVVIETNVGERRIALRNGSVATFYSDFCSAASELGLHEPTSSLLCELPPGAASFQEDDEERPWDTDSAELIWQGFASAASGLEDWQAPYRGHRPRTGVMWGGFDLSATRYRGARSDPPTNRPSFLQHGMTEEYVSVGFFFGNDSTPQSAMYAYIAPQPEGMETRAWDAVDATWNASAGLVLLPWTVLRKQPDPKAGIIAFGDAVYEAAAELAGWPRNLVGRRFTGWEASRTPPGEMP